SGSTTSHAWPVSPEAGRSASVCTTPWISTPVPGGPWGPGGPTRPRAARNSCHWPYSSRNFSVPLIRTPSVSSSASWSLSRGVRRRWRRSGGSLRLPARVACPRFLDVQGRPCRTIGAHVQRTNRRDDHAFRRSGPRKQGWATRIVEANTLPACDNRVLFEDYAGRRATVEGNHAVR